MTRADQKPISRCVLTNSCRHGFRLPAMNWSSATQGKLRLWAGNCMTMLCIGACLMGALVTTDFGPGYEHLRIYLPDVPRFHLNSSIITQGSAKWEERLALKAAAESVSDLPSSASSSSTDSLSSSSASIDFEAWLAAWVAE